MARVVVVGGGMIGLGSAMLLARDGHEVTVLERDPAPPCGPDDAWQTWTRRGVNQFRQGHFLLARFRAVMEAELPDVAAAMEDAGALRFNTLAGVPAEISGGVRPGDQRFDQITARRPVAEAVFARAANMTPGCDVRRGVPVKALGVVDGRVASVVADDGTVFDADLVVDAGGRRSAMSDLIDAAGLLRPAEERHDQGFVYYTRHFRSAEGTMPPAFGPLLQPYDSISIATLPADNGYWSVVVSTSGKDRQARALRDPDVWMQVVRSHPMVAHWVDAEPDGDGVDAMGAMEDRYRSFCIDGAPVAPGVLAVGDAFACTSPSIGRGLSLGMSHAVALRDVLRRVDGADAHELSLEWDHVTEATVAPYVRDTLFFDQHRLAQMDAQAAGTPYEPDDPEWDELLDLLTFGSGDPDVLRGLVDVMASLARPSEVLDRPTLRDRLISLSAAGREPLPGPDRRALVAMMEG